MNPKIKLTKLSIENFDDFSTIMTSMQVSRDCFCYGHRVFPEDIELGFPAQRRMKELVQNQHVHGLIVYFDEVPMLWIGVEPSQSLIGHDLYAEILEKESAKTWVIHCMTSTPDAKHRAELCTEGLREIISYTKAQGAEKLIGFPIKTSQLADVPVSRRFSGNEVVYESAGFQLTGEANKYFNIWAYEIVKTKPKLSLA